MIEVALLLALPPEQRQRYESAVRQAFPEIQLITAASAPEMIPLIRTAQVLIGFGPTITNDLIASAGRLEWIQAMGSGVDGIVDQPSLGSGVTVTNMHAFHGIPVSESALMSMLALARNFPRVLKNQTHSRWERFPARTLHGSNIAIWGVGAIAATLAPLCKAFGARVTGISSTPRSVAGFDRIYALEELGTALSEADFLVLLMPYNTATRGIVDAQVLKSMKPGSYLVNVARGGVLDEEALQQALASGHLAGAALDVFQTEPLPATHPLWTAPNLIVTPHLAGFFDRYPDHALPVILKNMRHYLDGDMAQMINKVRTP